MFSLPDIVRMNEVAAEAAKTKTLERQAQRPQDQQCIVCSWEGQENPAEYAYLVHDIYSDDAKDLIAVCEAHDYATGSPAEGFFECSGCNKVFYENFSWELFYAIVGCEQFCLPCALRSYISDPDNWIQLNAVQQVILDPSARQNDDGEDGWSRVFDPDNGVVNLAAVPHLIAVKMPLPDSIVFESNLEFDSSSGEMLRSYSSTYEKGVGENAALRELQELRDQGYTKVLAILDGAYQFSVSIGIYVDSTEKQAVDDAQQAQASALWQAHCRAILDENAATTDANLEAS